MIEHAAAHERKHRVRLVAGPGDRELRAELISRGTPAVPVKTGIDGGMNATFLAAVKSHGGPGAPIKTALGTIPAHVNPPPASDFKRSDTFAIASATSAPSGFRSPPPSRRPFASTSRRPSAPPSSPAKTASW